MRDLLRIALILGLAFASTFLVVQGLGLLPEEGVIRWLEGLRDIHPLWLMAGVIALLLLDLLIAVPTMTTILLAGWLLGPVLGGLTGAVGLMLMGALGYTTGRLAGRPILRRLFKDAARLTEIEIAFARNDILTLAVCQALPILPELSASLAGIARMHPARFALGYAAGSIPFAFILASGGAASSPDDLRPAILTAIAVTATLLLLWRRLARRPR
ncbi:MAG: VTT domain-containing protein [Rhodobacteraceae bacterium]|nr:VTT domain-containing protein [Paracoccaceae bacterium]